LRHWKAIVAVGFAAACVAVYLRLPKIARDDTPTYCTVLTNHIWYYRQETGDYPKSARELVEEVGPRMLAGGGLELSFLHDDVVLLEGPKRKIEVEYYYVSPDTMPTTTWSRR